MKYQIIQQPNGKYALWSNRIDDFICFDATEQYIIDLVVDQYRKEITEEVTGIMKTLKDGGKPYHQFTKTFEECLQRVRQVHGEQADTIKHLQKHK